jgi:hypothetical protein
MDVILTSRMHLCGVCGALERCSSFNVVETLGLGYVFGPLPALTCVLP